MAEDTDLISGLCELCVDRLLKLIFSLFAKCVERQLLEFGKALLSRLGYRRVVPLAEMPEPQMPRNEGHSSGSVHNLLESTVPDFQGRYNLA